MNQPTQTATSGEGGLAPTPDQIHVSGELEWPITTHQYAEWRGRHIDLTFVACEWKPRDLYLHIGYGGEQSRPIGENGKEYRADISTDEDLIVAAWFYLNSETSWRDLKYVDGDFERLLAARLSALMPDEPMLTEEEWAPF